jgi:AraC family transcriptional activator of pobA
MSTDLSGKIILFEEVLFCSDILKNELSPYNVNLSAHLNCTALSSVEFEKVLPIYKKYTDVYNAQVLLKEQARFTSKYSFWDL